MAGIYICNNNRQNACWPKMHINLINTLQTYIFTCILENYIVKNNQFFFFLLFFSFINSVCMDKKNTDNHIIHLYMTDKYEKIGSFCLAYYIYKSAAKRSQVLKIYLGIFFSIVVDTFYFDCATKYHSYNLRELIKSY